MKNIWEIFRRDIKRIKNNVIAMIVIMGITVVPCLYAWFNIAASWDPYGNTGNLKVAVASVDEGYEGSLIPLQINMGFYRKKKSHRRCKVRKILCSNCDTKGLQLKYDEYFF